MTDRELIEQWLRPGAIIPVNNNAIRVLLEALRDRLAQSEPVHAIDISQECVDETAKRKHDKGEEQWVIQN